jgi:hypothetical protein
VIGKGKEMGERRGKEKGDKEKKIPCKSFVKW